MHGLTENALPPSTTSPLSLRGADSDLIKSIRCRLIEGGGSVGEEMQG